MPNRASLVTQVPIGWPQQIWSAGCLTFEVPAPRSELMRYLNLAFSSTWDVARPLAVRYILKETSQGFRLSWVRGAGPAWFNPSPFLEATVSPSSGGSSVIGCLRLPSQTILNIVFSAAIGVLGIVASWLAKSPSGYAVFAAFVILPYLIVRLIFLPADLKGLVHKLEELVSRYGSDSPTPS